MKYVLLLFSMSLGIAGQLLMKKGVISSSLSPTFFSIVKTLLNPFVFAGIFSYAISSVIWLFVLQRFPLSVAYPAISMTYIVIMFLSLIFLNEPITLYKLIGTFLIVIGVFLIFK